VKGFAGGPKDAYETPTRCPSRIRTCNRSGEADPLEAVFLLWLRPDRSEVAWLAGVIRRVSRTDPTFLLIRGNNGDCRVASHHHLRIGYPGVDGQTEIRSLVTIPWCSEPDKERMPPFCR
jgi:hypothetical protein